MEKYKCKSVGIIGSGIQGVCVGLQLIKKGIPVTIFDRPILYRQNLKQLLMGMQDIFHLMLFYNLIDQIFYMMFQKCLLSSYGPLALNGIIFQK